LGKTNSFSELAEEFGDERATAVRDLRSSNLALGRKMNLKGHKKKGRRSRGRE